MLDVGIDYNGFGGGVSIGWPVESDTGMQEAGCCMWYQMAEHGFFPGGLGSWSINGHRPFKKTKFGDISEGVYFEQEGKAIEENSWYCSRAFGSGFNDCKKEHAILTASSFKGTGKAGGGVEISWSRNKRKARRSGCI